MADKRGKARKFRAPKLTRIENLTKGLLVERVENDIFAVKEVQGKGRGVFLRTEVLRKDSFVLEYKGDIISEAEASYRERIYARNNEGCFIMSFSYQGTKLACDATRHFDSYARLLNHSREPNIRFHPPFIIDLKGGLPRIASYALRDIYKGEEIVIDYGVRDGHISWLRNREIGFAADVDSDSSDSNDYTCPENSRADCHLSEKVSSANPRSPDDDVSSDVTSAEVFTLMRTDRQISEWNNIRKEKSSISLSGEYGLRFTRMVPGTHVKTFLAGFEDIGVPQKIMRFIEDTSKKRKQRSDAESVVCLSTSSSNTSKLSETASTLYRKNAFSCLSATVSDRISNIKLPSNKAPDSIHKVLEWQLTSSPQDSTMDIQIISIQSLSDSPCVEENSNIDHINSYRQQNSSAFEAQEISASIHPNHGIQFDRNLHKFHQDDQPSVSTSTSSPLPPILTKQNSTEEVVVNLDTSESDDKSDSSSFSFFSINIEKEPNPSGEASLKRKTDAVEPTDVYVVSDDECVPQTDATDQQLNSVNHVDLSKENCSAVSYNSKCELLYTAEDEECEILWSELPVPSNEQGKLSSNWPPRRPVGFSSPPAQQKVAVIKPYIIPCASGITLRDNVAMTESELEEMKIIFHPLLFSNKSSYHHVQQAIFRNWDFFSILINRGVSINQIRTTVNNLFKNN